MLSFALVSAAVASGTALTKPAENPLRRLSESDPSGGLLHRRDIRHQDPGG